MAARRRVWLMPSRPSRSAGRTEKARDGPDCARAKTKGIRACMRTAAPVLNSRVAAALAGVAGGACGGAGAGRRRNTIEVQIMTKSRKAPRSKLAGKHAAKISRKRTAPRDIRGHDTVLSPLHARKTGGEPQACRPRRPVHRRRATILALLQRPTGAAIGDLTEATGWQGQPACALLWMWPAQGSESSSSASKLRVTDDPSA